MHPTQHRSNNDVLGAPPGQTVEQCRPLAITRAQYADGTPVVQSFWRPNAAELAALAAGAVVVLQVVGRTHPPLWVSVDGVDG